MVASLCTDLNARLVPGARTHATKRPPPFASRVGRRPSETRGPSVVTALRSRRPAAATARARRSSARNRRDRLRVSSPATVKRPLFAAATLVWCVCGAGVPAPARAHQQTVSYGEVVADDAAAPAGGLVVTWRLRLRARDLASALML